MTADKQPSAAHPAERRVYPRVPLDAPYFVTLRRRNGPDVPCLLVDFSRGGVQLALPPDSDENFHAWLSHTVSVCELPELIGCERGGCKGMISWVSAERCGVRFDPPLAATDETLHEVARNL